MAATQPRSIRDLVNDWTRKSGANLDLHSKLELLTMLGNDLYSQYQPCPEKPEFLERLFTWVNGAPRVSDKKTLFELAPWLLFVGVDEMVSLYRSSFTGQITRWLIDQSRIDIASPNLTKAIRQARKETFFGSIAGMDMGTYCRVNGIQQSIRPDFRERANIGDPIPLAKYLQKKYKRIVAVEDYVGTGTQMAEACEYLETLKGFPILICPMIVAPEGVKKGNELAKGNISFQPVYCVQEQSGVPEIARKGARELPFFGAIRKSLLRLYGQVEGKHPTQPLYGPFGFGDTGSLLLTYLNCPDNVPPVVHHLSDTWSPLFQRSPREG